MANKTIALRLSELTGITGLKLRLLDAGTLVNTGGDTLTETSNGWFTCTVTEAVTAKFYDVEVVNSSDGLEASGGRIYFSGDTESTFIVDDPSLAATSTNQTTILDRIGNFTGSGVNTILGFFKALLNKAASTPSDVGGTFSAATDSTEAIRDALTTGGVNVDELAASLRAKLAGSPIRLVRSTTEFGKIDLNVGSARTLDFGNAISLTLTTTADLTGATTKFVATHQTTGERFEVDGAISSATGGYSLVYEIESANTANLTTGEWSWRVAITLDGNTWIPNEQGDQLFVHPFP